MPDASRELQIKITGDASGAVGAARETAGAFNETSGATEKLNHHHGELMKSARELSRQFPEVAAGLRLLAGPTGAIIVGIELFKKLKESIDEQNKALDEAIEKNADATFLEAINAKREALEKFRIELEAYAEKLSGAVNSEAEYKKQIEEEITLLHERAQAQANVSNAQQGLDTARLEQNYKLGLIAAKDYYAQLAALEIQHRNDQLKRQQEEDKAELELQNKKLARAYGRLGELSVATNRDQGAEEGLVGKVAADKADLKRALDSRPAAEKESLASLAAADSEFGGLQYARSAGERGVSSGKAIADRADAAVQKLKALDTEINRLQGRLPGEESALGRAGRAAGRDESESVSVTKEIQDLKDTIADLRDKFAIKEGGASDSALRENYATLLKTNPDSFDSAFSLDKAAGVQQALATHKQVSDLDKQFYERVVQMMEERGQTAQQAHNALALISGNQRNMAEKLHALIQEAELVQGRLRVLTTFGSQ